MSRRAGGALAEEWAEGAPLLPYAHLLTGSLAGLAKVAAAHPLDTVKVRVQALRAPAAPSATRVFVRTLTREGARGLYRGATLQLGINVLYNSVLFGTFGRARAEGGLSATAAAAAAGLAVAPVISPLEMVRCRWQVLKSTRGASSLSRRSAPKSILQVAQSVVRRGGPAALYRGFPLTVLREMPGAVVYFGTFAGVSDWLGGGGGAANNFVAGGAAGLANWATVAPVDMLKTRVQTDSVRNPRYSSSLHAARSVLAAEGLSAVYRGLGPCLLRAVVANGAGFAAIGVACSVLGLPGPR